MKTVTTVYKKEKIDCEICEGYSVLQREEGLGHNNLTVCSHCNGVGKLEKVIYKNVTTPENVDGRFIFWAMRLLFKNFYVTYNFKVFDIKKKKGLQI